MLRFLVPAAALTLPIAAVVADTATTTAVDATPAKTPEVATGDAVPAAPAKKGTGDGISAAEIDMLLSKLAQMRGGLDAEARRAIAEALKVLTPAAAETSKALALYTESVRAADFDKSEKADKTAGDFEDWRKKNDDRLHDAGFAAALRIRYRYLKLCLECDTIEKADAALPAIVTLQSDAIAAYATAGQFASVMRDDVSSDPVARRFKVEKYKPEGWSGAALDLEGHFGRAVKQATGLSPETIPAIWDTRLKLERSLAEATDKNALQQKRKRQAEQNKNARNGGRAHGPGRAEPDSSDDAKAVTDFETTRLPRLMWRMAEDYQKAGLYRRGFETMFAVIMKYPKHPDVSDWVDRMTEMANALKEGGDPAAVEAKPGKPDNAPGERGGRRRAGR